MLVRPRAVLGTALFLLLTWALGATPYDEGRAAFGSQDWKSAVSALERFVAESPRSPEAPTAAFLRGVALYQLGDYRTSLDAFQKIERTWPQSPMVQRLPYWKGTAALGAGQHALAERELLAQTKITDQEPFTTRSWLNLALARIALGKIDLAIEALSSFTRLSQEPPLLAQAWATWGDLEHKAGRSEAALGHYRSSWESNPGDRWDLWSRTQAVDVLTGLGRFAEARRELEAGSLRFPAEADRWESRRIVVAKGLGDGSGLARALEAVWSREKDAKKKQELASNRARTAEELGKPEALWWLRASQGPDPSLGLAAILRYSFWLETDEKPGEAAAALEAWAAKNKTAPLTSLEEVRSRAALDRLGSGEPQKAAALWDKLISEFPRSARMPGWLLARGRVSLEAQDTTKALADFSRLLKDHPKAAEGPEARYQTGLVYLKRQEPIRAEAWFYGLVEELGSGDLYQRALLARGICFVNAGKTELARGSLQRLIRESPTGVWTGEAWSALGRNALQAALFEEAAEAFGLAELGLTDPVARASALWSRAEALAAQPAAVQAASEAYARYAVDYPAPPRAAEARYRQGAVFFTAKDWNQALEVWTQVVGWVAGSALVQVREGMAVAQLRLLRPDDGWKELETLEASGPHPESWYRWGLAATSLGLEDWGVRAFQYLLQHHPSSSVAEAALPRAAGALLSGGRPDEALARYADYFQKFGQQPSSAPVARAAGIGALAYPATLEALVAASRTWRLAPEVAAEFSLVWAQSRLDADTESAQAELKALSQSAPWASQRSEALLVLGRWHLDRGRVAEARRWLEPAASLGDDLALFRARWVLARVTEAEGDLSAAARQRESTEKAAGPGVPLEFRIQVLQEAADTWTKAGKGDDASRVNKRIAALAP